MATTRRLVCITSVLTLMVAVPASGQSLVDGYAPPGGKELSDVAPAKVDQVSQVRGAVDSAPIAQNASNPASTPSAPTAVKSTPQVSGSKLPFTGLDVRLILIGGLLLAVVGFGTRRLADRIK